MSAQIFLQLTSAWQTDRLFRFSVLLRNCMKGGSGRFGLKWIKHFSSKSLGSGAASWRTFTLAPSLSFLLLRLHWVLKHTLDCTGFLWRALVAKHLLETQPFCAWSWNSGGRETLRLSSTPSLPTTGLLEKFESQEELRHDRKAMHDNFAPISLQIFRPCVRATPRTGLENKTKKLSNRFFFFRSNQSRWVLDLVSDERFSTRVRPTPVFLLLFPECTPPIVCWLWTSLSLIHVSHTSVSVVNSPQQHRFSFCLDHLYSAEVIFPGLPGWICVDQLHSIQDRRCWRHLFRWFFFFEIRTLTEKTFPAFS